MAQPQGTAEFDLPRHNSAAKESGHSHSPNKSVLEGGVVGDERETTMEFDRTRRLASCIVERGRGDSEGAVVMDSEWWWEWYVDRRRLREPPKHYLGTGAARLSAVLGAGDRHALASLEPTVGGGRWLAVAVAATPSLLRSSSTFGGRGGFVEGDVDVDV